MFQIEIRNGRPEVIDYRLPENFRAMAERLAGRPVNEPEEHRLVQFLSAEIEAAAREVYQVVSGSVGLALEGSTVDYAMFIPLASRGLVEGILAGEHRPRADQPCSHLAHLIPAIELMLGQFVADYQDDFRSSGSPRTGTEKEAFARSIIELIRHYGH